MENNRKKETKVEAKAWKAAVLRKIGKCLENQNHEQKKQAAYQKKLGIDTENIELKKEKAREAIDTHVYETTETSKPNNPEENSMAEGQDSYSTHGIMRILTNPNKEIIPTDKDELLNELLDEEELYNTFAKEIEQDLAELEQDKVINQDRSHKVCRCGLNDNRKTGTKCDNNITVADAIQQPASRIRRIQEKARTDKHKRPVDITSGKPFTWDTYRIGPCDDEPCKVALKQKGECP